MSAVRRPLPFVLLALAFAPAASAQDAEPAEEVRGHYDKEAIPAASSVFKSIGESSARTFEKVEANLQRTDGALAKMDLSVALARGAVDTGAWDLAKAKLDARSDTFAYEFKGIQGRFDQVGVAYEEAFGAALERALAGLTAEKPGAIVECRPKQTSALEALGGGAPGASAKKADPCPGTNFTDEIARRWDGDAELEERLLDVVGGDLGPLIIGMGADGPIEYGGELDGRGWPAITAYEEPDAVLAVQGQGGATWIHPADLTVAFPELAEALDRINTLAADSRSVLSDAAAALPRDPATGNLVQDDATLAKVDTIQNAAKGIRGFTEDKRAEIGALLWAALNKSRKKGKKGGWSDAGICVNPPAFGGCAGTDVTDAVADFLGSDKKLQAALTELMESLEAPSAL